MPPSTLTTTTPVGPDAEHQAAMRTADLAVMWGWTDFAIKLVRMGDGSILATAQKVES